MELIKRIPPWAFMVAACAVIVGYLVFAYSLLAGGYESARRGGEPFFSDFAPKYAASMLVQHEAAANLYVPERMFEAGKAAAQAAYGGTLNERQAQGVGFAPWMYPPYFIFLIYPLASLPFLAAMLAWLAVTAVPYVLAIGRAIRGRFAWLVAFASPPSFYNLVFGQTGFLSAGLIGLGLSQVYARPVLAGLCVGLASVKPHLGVLLPLALVAGEHWKPFGIATITVVGLISASVMAFGMDPWYGLIGTLEFYGKGFEAGAYSYRDMVTVHGMFKLAGAEPGLAWKAQVVSGLAAVVVVVWAWWRRSAHPDHLGLQVAIVCAATLLTIPMAYSYDAVLLVPAVAWIWADMKARGASALAMSSLALATAALLPLKAIASATHFQYAPFVFLIVLIIAVSRLRDLRVQTGESQRRT